MKHAHPHDHAHSHAPTDRAGLLAHAETLCREAGESFTPLRRQVLELLLDADGPAKAYDLLAGIKTEGAPAKPPTIYRALEFLMRLGLAHRIESLNAYVACGIGGCARTTIFLICRQCGHAVESDAGHALVDVGEAAAHGGFRLERTMIEAHGLCRTCQNPS
jgi:Fur family zinc uptake transcriptional regulator